MTSHLPSPAGRRPVDARHGGVARLLATLAHETAEAFEVLARRHYDAPWQRLSTRCNHAR